MDALTITLVSLQILLSLILVAVVLFQHGSQYGLSGSIAGGAETFFGKNSGRTIDAKLKKLTGIVAILFLICSIALAVAVKKPDTGESSVPITEGGYQDVPGADGLPVVPEGEAPIAPEGDELPLPDEGDEGAASETNEPGTNEAPDGQ